MYQVYLKRNEEKRIKSGGSFIYANEVDKIEGKDTNGSLSSVYSYDHKFLGRGYINHLSKILVRILIRDETTKDDEAFFMERIKKANDFRTFLGYRSAYRMVFSEADAIPGLIVDRYEDYLVIEISSLGLEIRKELIVKALINLFNPKGIYEKVEENLRSKEGLKSVSGTLYGEIPSEVIIEENGLVLSVDIINGQKTGYFLDQKENRLLSRKYTKNMTVLDCFSNTGGFSLNAAIDAKSVTAVDISKRATDNVLRNAELNHFNNIEVITDDVFKVLRDMREANKTFGVVILDPPAFTKSISQTKDALRGYKDINILGMKIVSQGGFLITSSCSEHISRNLFENMLIEAAREAGKQVRCLEVRSQSPDHPSLLSAEETSYLKFYVLQIM